jgi:hypothetical protein
MPGLSYGTKDGKELQTYLYLPEFGINELPFIYDTVEEGSPVPGPGDRSQAILIDCSTLSAGRTKSIRLAGYDSGSANVILNLWFADTKEDLETLVATRDPAQIPMLHGSIDVTLPVSSSWFAIDYDSATSGTISPSTMNIIVMLA